MLRSTAVRSFTSSKGAQYIRLTTWDMTVGSGQFASNGAGAQIDPGYPAPISNWGWGNFGKNGIDAALYSKSVCYFFKDNQYIRVHRGDEGPGTVDKGYPAPISNWKWGAFGANGIDAALNADNYAYFFKGNQYIRCTRNDDEGPGTVRSRLSRPHHQLELQLSARKHKRRLRCKRH